MAGGDLKRGRARSCGCINAEISKARPVGLIDIAGKRFGRLLVIKRIGEGMWECLCDCGTVKAINGRYIRDGHTASCGCLYREVAGKHFKTHGKSCEPGAGSWYNMIDRCYNPQCKAFQYYGGRGITVCDRWRGSISNFLEDMGPMPAPGYTIERKDVQGNYEPSNCVWLEKKYQGWNTRKTRFIEFNGQKKSLSQWSQEKGFARHVIKSRLSNGWTLQDAMTLPLHSRPKNPGPGL